MNEAESQSYAAMAEKSRKMGLPMIGSGCELHVYSKNRQEICQ